VAMATGGCDPDLFARTKDEADTEWPTGPVRPTETNLRGTVIDAVTLVPLPGAKVDAGVAASVADSLGTYNLQRLTMAAVDLVTTRNGYDTLKTLLPLEGGDKSFTIRLRASTPPP
ncbi:MAG: hypothetical protein ACKOH8_04930, partial [Gemmatimonadota bacterium]